jgi:hypothetical protein
MGFQSLTWRGCGDGATSAFPMPFATRCVSSARSRRGISRSWSVGRPGVRTWEPNGRGSRSRGSGTAGAAAAGRCTGATATFASTDTTVWRPHPASRSYCRRSGEIRQRSSGGRTGAQGTMASVTADRRRSGWFIDRAQPGGGSTTSIGVTGPGSGPGCAWALRARPDGRPPSSVTGSRRVARSRWRQRHGRTVPRAGHHVCCGALRSPPPGLR